MRSGNDDVKIGALETLGNLAFQPKNRAAFMADTDLLAWISRLAQDQVRSEGGALADPRRCVVRDANANTSASAGSADIPCHRSVHDVYRCNKHSWLLEPLLEADCLQPSGVCAADM